MKKLSEMTDKERYGEIGAEIRRLDPEAYKNRPKTLEGNLSLLRELREKRKTSEETAPPRRGPSTRGGNRTPTVTVTARREETPGQRYRGEYGETSEALSNLTPEQKEEALKFGVGTALSMVPLARAIRGPASFGQSGRVNVRGATLAERERSASAAADYAGRTKLLKETAEGRARLSRGSSYKSGGSVKSYAGGGRIDGCAIKGKTKGTYR